MRQTIKITPNFSEKFQNEFKILVDEAIDFSRSLGQRNPSLMTSKDLLQIDNDRRKFYSYIKDKCNIIFQDDRELIFIPAGISLLATLSDQL